MTVKKTYKIVSAEKLDDLAALVNSEIENGYWPVGAPFTAPVKNNRGRGPLDNPFWWHLQMALLSDMPTIDVHERKPPCYIGPGCP